MGNCVDILASVATLFGVATSLGFGVQQVNAGLAHVLGIQRESLDSNAADCCDHSPQRSV